MQWLFLLYLLLKPFYIFESGTLQPSDAILVVCFFYYICISRKSKLFQCSIDIILLIFVAFVFVINLIYYLIYFETEFIVSSMYYVFNLMLVLVFRTLVLDRSFLKKLFMVCRINLWVQLGIYVTGLGRFYVDANGETGRYLGSFNDPNQFAFFCFCLVLTMFMITQFDSVDAHINILDYMLLVFMVYVSSSTGMFLAICVFFFSYILTMIFSSAGRRNPAKRKQAVHVLVTVMIVAIAVLLMKNTLGDIVENSMIYQRIMEKLSMSETSGGTTVWQDRNIDKVYLYPLQNLFGAGQGYYYRFSRAYSSGEIHSTLLSILFCYGVVPLLIVLNWMKRNIRRTTWLFVPVFLSLLIESFTLLNQRQPFFWMFFVLAYSYKILERESDENAVCP